MELDAIRKVGEVAVPVAVRGLAGGIGPVASARQLVASGRPSTAKSVVSHALGDMRTHNPAVKFDLLLDDPDILPSSPIPRSGPALTLSQALSNVKTFLGTIVSPAAVTALRGSPDGATAESLRNAAAQALLSSRPSGALAALILADDKQPRDPMVLASLASVVARLGRPAEAVALLAAAGQASISRVRGRRF